MELFEERVPTVITINKKLIIAVAVIVLIGKELDRPANEVTVMVGISSSVTMEMSTRKEEICPRDWH